MNFLTKFKLKCTGAWQKLIEMSGFESIVDTVYVYTEEGSDVCLRNGNSN